MTDMPIKSKRRGWFGRRAPAEPKPEPEPQQDEHDEFTTPQVQYPLDREKIAELLSLEDLFVRGLLNRTKVETLLDIYRVCAEFYDSVKDPINIYFSEKIQYTVSQKNVLALLSKPKTGSGCGEETLATRRRKESGDKLRRTAEAANEARHKKDKKTSLENEQMLRSQRVKMGFEIDQQLKDETDKAHNLLMESVNTKKKIDDLVSKNLDSQKDAIRSKLEQRRTASFMKSRSRLNSSIGSAGNFKINNTIGGLDTSQNPFGDTSMVSIGKLENESPLCGPKSQLSSSSKKNSYFNLFGDVLTDPEFRLDMKPTDIDHGDSKVKPFTQEENDDYEGDSDKELMKSFDSDNDDASIRNILNGCPIRDKRKGSRMLGDLAGTQGTTLHCIYEEPSPTKLSQEQSTPADEKGKIDSPTK